MIELIAVALGISPAFTRTLKDEEIDGVYYVADKHRLRAVTAVGLKKAGYANEKFNVALAQAEQKSLLFDAEYRKIAALLNAASISYVPLKGMVLKKLYPKTGMREMSDIDILFDRGCASKVREIMFGEGYECTQYDRFNHDVYVKSPYFIFEMHRTLFDELTVEMQRFFSKKDYLSQSSGGMSAEDFYVHLIAHAFQHYRSAGIGIRPLIDCCLYLDHYGRSLDLERIAGDLRELGLEQYEQSLRQLSKTMWQPEKLTEQEKQSLDYYIFSGAFGNKKQLIRNTVTGKIDGKSVDSKLGYLKSRFTVSQRKIKNDPFYSKHPKLIPLKRTGLLIKAAITRPKDILYELKELGKTPRKH